MCHSCIIFYDIGIQILITRPEYTYNIIIKWKFDYLFPCNRVTLIDDEHAGCDQNRGFNCVALLTHILKLKLLPANLEYTILPAKHSVRAFMGDLFMLSSDRSTF